MLILAYFKVMPFGMVIGVGPGIHVLDGGSHVPKGRGCFEEGYRQQKCGMVHGLIDTREGAWEVLETD